MDNSARFMRDNMYLLQYTSDGEFVCKIASMIEIADTIGFSDCTDYTDFQVFRLVRGKNPEALVYHTHERYRPCTVTLYDRFGNYIDDAEYADH